MHGTYDKAIGKSEGTKSMAPHKGGSSGDSRGGSSRHYPKSTTKPGDSDSAPFNPQKVAATDKYVGGV